MREVRGQDKGEEERGAAKDIKGRKRLKVKENRMRV